MASYNNFIMFDHGFPTDSLSYKYFYLDYTFLQTSAAPSGWPHKINGVANADISKINGVAIADIAS